LWQGVATLLGFFLQPVLEARSSALFDMICISVIPADSRCFFALSVYRIYIFFIVMKMFLKNGQKTTHSKANQGLLNVNPGLINHG